MLTRTRNERELWVKRNKLAMKCASRATNRPIHRTYSGDRDWPCGEYRSYHPHVMRSL